MERSVPMRTAVLYIAFAFLLMAGIRVDAIKLDAQVAFLPIAEADRSTGVFPYDWPYLYILARPKPVPAI